MTQYTDLTCAWGWLNHPTIAHKAACLGCNPGKTVPELNAAFSALHRHMTVHLRFDQESFDELKELLRVAANSNLGKGALDESVTSRTRREALKRIYDQIRDVTYSDV